MYNGIESNLLWFCTGFIFTFWGLLFIAKRFDRPALILKGVTTYIVIWVSLTIALHLVL